MRKIKFLCLFWGMALVFVGLWFFVYPMVTTMWYSMTDSGLRKPGGSAVAFDWHQKLSGRYERYAEERVASGQAEKMDTFDIAGTEWPLFGSVFYLWATSQLQEAWEADNRLATRAPAEYARGAIEAATTLVLDEGHATWVKDHWGKTEYLQRENVFYRMLVMWAIMEHHRLTGDVENFPMLRKQCDSLADEIDASPFGLLDDYPGQCYPTDVVAALAAIRSADGVLGLDHGAMLQRASRGFTGKLARPFGLPPYAADSARGLPLDGSRGCGNSYLCSFGGEVWPERGDDWYRDYIKHFWQQNRFAAGFREFPAGEGKDWYFDVDAGPVLGGFGSAASAFGVAAARTNGDFPRAYTMSVEMLAMAWPLPNGTLLLPRLVSDRDHAPHLGEMAILFQLSREPLAGVNPTLGKGAVPGCVWTVWAVQLLAGTLLLWRGSLRIRRGLGFRSTAARCRSHRQAQGADRSGSAGAGCGG